MNGNFVTKTLFLIVFLLSFTHLNSQSSPKREFRGVWIATVLNIDWPSSPGLPTRQQQNEIDQLLDYYHSMNFNAIILQVRPSSDALYPSSFEPWSEYLTGEQGKAPNPFYDPLDYIIAGCHKRGMELHAWLNPFRVKQKNANDLIKGHVLTEHPEWGWEYGSKTYLDPGVPEAREYVINIVKDIVNRYDIDAIHFDDYFYPYPIKGLKLPDAETFEKHGALYGSEDIDVWRRSNINLFVKTVNEEIKQIKPWMLLGISPFGVWRNNADDENGSKTMAGITAYDNLYADVLKWLKMGWVDYVAPQLYWQFGHISADFTNLSEWWNSHSYGRNIYVGHGLYRLTQPNSEPAWKNPLELPRQIVKVRDAANIKGSIWFSSNHFFKINNGFIENLKDVYYKNKALVPTSPWINNIPPKEPVNLKAYKAKDHSLKIKWDSPIVSEEINKPKFYVIYRAERGDKIDPDDPKYIFDVVKHPEILIKVPLIRFKRNQFVYRVSCIDRLNNESKLSNAIVISQ